MWDNIIASSLVIGILLVIYGIVNSLVRKRKMKQAKVYFEQLQSAIVPGREVILLGGILATIKTVNDSSLTVIIGEDTTINCLIEAVQQVVS